jgi:hypothetical protein
VVIFGIVDLVAAVLNTGAVDLNATATGDGVEIEDVDFGEMRPDELSNQSARLLAMARARSDLFLRYC